MNNYSIHWPQFYTATINEWKFLLENDIFKNIIISCLKYLVDNKKIKIHAFVIMDNHIHLIWQALGENNPIKIRHNFMKFTAQQMKFELMKSEDYYLQDFKVKKDDRVFQIWKRNALSVELFSKKFFVQKLNYIHDNPVKAGLCIFPEDYKYSSASYYNGGGDYFGIMKG